MLSVGGVGSHIVGGAAVAHEGLCLGTDVVKLRQDLFADASGYGAHIQDAAHLLVRELHVAVVENGHHRAVKVPADPLDDLPLVIAEEGEDHIRGMSPGLHLVQNIPFGQLCLTAGQPAPAGEGTIELDKGHGHILQNEPAGIRQGPFLRGPALMVAHILMDDLDVVSGLHPFPADVMAHTRLLVVIAVAGVQPGDKQYVHFRSFLVG